MKLTNIANFKTIGDFIEHKIKSLDSKPKTFENLFRYMFAEKDNIMAEILVGYRIKKTTYGEVKAQVYKKASALKRALSCSKNGAVGIYMENSLDFLITFWAVLMCGHSPLLLNQKLSGEILDTTLIAHNVIAVVSENKTFCVPTIFSKDLDKDCELEDFGDWGKEVIFMSSGTTDNVKLCFYTAENFFYQLSNSVDIFKKCPQIASHYQGELKLLTLLPFYHVFGFMAVYLWFGFFSRTFVFLNDLSAKTIQSAIKRHSITHFFAVPLVWEAVYKGATNKIKNKGPKTYNKFIKGLNIINQNKLGKAIALKQMEEVRENLFGDSIKFLISGGGFISREALEFFNGIGYHLANGYGMTEVGITSVELSSSRKIRNSGSIGSPFINTEYKIDSNGSLLIKGKNVAYKIAQKDKEITTNYQEWFNSNDLAKEKDGKYYLLGRSDDLIIHPSGENLNPVLIENALKIPRADRVCLINALDTPVLLIEAKSCYTIDSIKQTLDKAKEQITRLNLSGLVNKIYITKDNLLDANDFKLNRRKITKKYLNNQINLLDEGYSGANEDVFYSALQTEIVKIFAQTLSIEQGKIGLNSNFFTDLNGSSLDYFMLADRISAHFGVDIKSADGQSLNTVYEIANFIKTH